MTNTHIPPEAVEAAARAAHDLWRKQASIGDDIAEYEQWDDVSRFYKDELRAQATAAIRAALTAWPGMWVEQLWEAPRPVQGIILPLTEPEA